jgi:hypothetical protein
VARAPLSATTGGRLGIENRWMFPRIYIAFEFVERGWAFLITHGVKMFMVNIFSIG